MKHPLLPSLSILACVLLSACGPSQEEIQKRQLLMMDSVVRATENRMAQKALEEKNEQERIRKEKEENLKRKKDRRRLSEALLRMETELAVQEQKLEDIKAPKFLRTIDVKEEQVRNQLIIIQHLKSAAQTIREKIQLIDSGESYSMEEDAMFRLR